MTTDPSSETVWPAHSFLKSALRQSDAFSTLVSVAPAHGQPRWLAAGPWDAIDPRHGYVENATVVSGSQQVALLRALVVSERTLLEHPLYAADARAIIQDAEREMAALGVAVGPGSTPEPGPLEAPVSSAERVAIGWRSRAPGISGQ